MKHIILTYSNGDRESSILNENAADMIRNIIDTDFKSAWFSKDANGHYTNVTNMVHVRSIVIVDGDDDAQLEDWKTQDQRSQATS